LLTASSLAIVEEVTSTDAGRRGLDSASISPDCGGGGGGDGVATPEAGGASIGGGGGGGKGGGGAVSTPALLAGDTNASGVSRSMWFADDDPVIEGQQRLFIWFLLLFICSSI